MDERLARYRRHLRLQYTLRLWTTKLMWFSGVVVAAAAVYLALS